MRVRVNGEVRETASDATVASLLASLGIDPRKVAVERNREIVPKSLYARTALGADDALEIVQFVGGG